MVSGLGDMIYASVQNLKPFSCIYRFKHFAFRGFKGVVYVEKLIGGLNQNIRRVVSQMITVDYRRGGGLKNFKIY